MADLSDNTNWFETDASNNKASPNGWPEGMMPSGVNDTARGDKGALKRFWDRINPVQTIAPASGLWQFTTANSAYPTGYVDGEIYSFKATAFSVGGDQFQVNALGVKPIWRLNGTPIIANDIVSSGAPQIIYQAALNGGAGAFLLLNPFIPISGDGAGGISVAGGASLGSLTVGTVAVSGGLTAASIGTNTLQANGGGTAISAPNGNIETAGQLGGNTLSIGTTGYFGGDVTIGGGGTALSVPSGGITVGSSVSCQNVFAGNDVAAAGVFRRSTTGGGDGARIECAGGDYDNITFAMGGGSLHVSIDGGANGFVYNSDGGFSDIRLKENIRDTDANALAMICATPIREFLWNDEGRRLMPLGPEAVPCGFVAQEVEKAIPVAVEEGSAFFANGMKRVVDDRLTPYLFRAIQQLTERVVELEGRLARE